MGIGIGISNGISNGIDISIGVSIGIGIDIGPNEILDPIRLNSKFFTFVRFWVQLKYPKVVGVIKGG